MTPGLKNSKVFRDKPKNLNQSGFTLIELLVVISIISFLASIMLVNLATIRIKTRDLVRIQNKENIKKALIFYQMEQGNFPNSDTGSGPTYKESCIAGTSETCFGGFITGYDGLRDALSPYVSGNLLNKPYSPNPTDGFAFSSSEAWPLTNDGCDGLQVGDFYCKPSLLNDGTYYPFLVWMQERTMGMMWLNGINEGGPCPINDGHSFVSSYSGIFLCHEWFNPARL